MIQEVLMGNVVSAGLGQNRARQSAIFAGLPDSVGATTINKVCGSGLKTVMLASQAIRAGDGDLFLAGGMENMSRAPYLVPGRTGELRYGHAQLTDALLHDGLWDPFENWGMGDAAEFIAEEFQVSRQEMDEFALSSHQKAAAANDTGKFAAEIVPVEIKAGKTIDRSYFDNLIFWRQLTGIAQDEGYVVYGGQDSIRTGIGSFISWKKLNEIKAYD
jgi:acetyl-CoA C-acetyltransferase